MKNKKLADMQPWKRQVGKALSANLPEVLRDLGYELEFRSGIEIGYVFCNKSRLGVHFYHISNASLGRKNPGEEACPVPILYQ